MTKDRQNWKRAWCYFVGIGKIPVDAKKNEYVLHHKDWNLKHTDRVRYDEWRIEDLEVMLKSEHTRMHQKGRRRSEEEIQKIRIAHLGKHHSENTKKLIGEKSREMWQDEEYHEKMTKIRQEQGEANRGKHAYNDGENIVYAYECPEGFVPGMTEDSIKRMSEAQKGKVWSEEQHRKFSESIKKYYEDPENRKRRSEIAKRPRSEAWKKSMSNSRSKAVLQFDLDGNLIAEFKNGRIAANSMGLKNGSNLCTAIKKNIPYHDFIFKYKE